jgi:hypothetical protein
LVDTPWPPHPEIGGLVEITEGGIGVGVGDGVAVGVGEGVAVGVGDGVAVGVGDGVAVGVCSGLGSLLLPSLHPATSNNNAIANAANHGLTLRIGVFCCLWFTCRIV